VAFAEVFGMPLRLGKYDPSASSGDKDALLAAVRSLGSDAAGIISKSTEIEFVESVKNAGTNNIYEALAGFCDKQMSKAILGQTATTEGTPGKLGNEDAQDKVRHDLIRSDAEALSKTIRFQILRPLVGYNFGWDKPLPWFKIKYEPAEDLQAASDVYVNLSQIGFCPSAEHVSERFNIPLPKKGETALQAPLGTGMVPGKVVVRANSVSAQPSPQPPPDPADMISDRLGAESMAVTDAAFMAPIKRLVESANSLEEIRDGILNIYADLDPAELGELIARAMASADLAGRYEARSSKLKAQSSKGNENA
jgi:phage gp29-like protein